MPRIRTIKPDFFFDFELAQLPHQTRLFYIGLWTQSDKVGRMKYEPEKIRALIMPYEEFDIEKTVQTLIPKFIQRYEVDDRVYLQIINFLKHQRPHHTEPDSVLPVPPPLDNGVQTVKPRIKKVGREGKGRESVHRTDKQPSSSKAKNHPGFEPFWDEFKRKDAKQSAQKTWDKLKPSTELSEHITKRVRQQFATRVDWQKEEHKFAPLGATYLNGRRWEDPDPKPYKDPDVYD